ncbi:ribosomal protein S18-alanine N-acetyltransferase [Derxia lacustris]|uniref:ribosomal protein S18-alanine N-acetyltransferase n=1 Tax=Derxia lacustris TaxID=764842 RepID=UPI000A1735CD|nr:ribosomal protein S18-alanine N-acetyltransferase [Derxia lacustris]
MAADPTTVLPVLRAMTEDDVPAVMRIEKQAYPFPWTAGNFVDSIRNGYRAGVACLGADPIGYVVLLPALDEAHLLNITIAPEHQRQGLGGWLLERSIELARDAGAACMILEVRPSNLPARALYDKRGFAQIGLRKGYYPNGTFRREDAIVMRLCW